MRNPIAELQMQGVRGKKRRFPITVQIGIPHENRKTGDWACPIALNGLYGKMPDMVGVDSLQALSLALRLAGYLLADFTKKGGCLLDMNGLPISLEPYFGAAEDWQFPGDDDGK